VPAVSLGHFVALSIVLFFMGAVGVLSRKNALIVLMSIELMLNAANLAIAAFARYWLQADGQVIVFFVIAIAAVEAAIGLAILVEIFRLRRSVDLEAMSSMRE